MKLITLIFILTFLGCSSIKESIKTKRDNKAFSRVIASPTLRDKVTQIGNALHPVTTYPIYIKGKDSVIYKIGNIYHDTTIYKYLPSNINKDSLIRELAKSIPPDTITIHRTDIQQIKDTNCTHQYQILSAQFYDLDGQSKQKDIQIKTLETSLNKKGWWIFGISLISILIIAGELIIIIRGKR